MAKYFYVAEKKEESKNGVLELTNGILITSTCAETAYKELISYLEKEYGKVFVITFNRVES